MIEVGVLGARGRMGSQVCQAVAGADGMRIAAGVDEGDSRDALAGCDVVVDFTHPGAVMDNLRWCVGKGLDTIVGTSGLTRFLAEYASRKPCLPRTHCAPRGWRW